MFLLVFCFGYLSAAAPSHSVAVRAKVWDVPPG
jgi:hypothetical protein